MQQLKLQKLPIGIQTFSEIRTDDYIYIDKTHLALKLIQNYKYTFLSRPRRFGKSLFLDTLRNIFEGKKEYFKNLAIEDKWDWSISYPVILISFVGGNLQSKTDLQEKLQEILKENQKRLNIVCEENPNPSICFRELIIKANEKYKQKAVVLIDEYDKPILDNIENVEIAKTLREELRGFYSVIKGSDEFLRFAFLTGVSKFTKTSIFSGLNNITDISLDMPYGDICGYSQKDVETSFAPYLEGVNMQKLKSWYNGYNFLDSNMYNPFDILQFIAKGHLYRNYWFETGTPTFLMKLIEKNHYFLPNLANLKVDEKLLNSFDIENLDLEVILYQAGYLTIDRVEEKARGGLLYYLKIPNKEVGQSLSDYIIEMLIPANTTKRIDAQDNIYMALENHNMQAFKSTLISIFASIPYANYTKNNISKYEGFYASVVYVYLQSLGLDIVGEDVTNKGRIDLTIKMDEAIYVLEFKVDSNANALEQIKSKNYHQKYLHDNKEIYLIGIHFDTNEKNISNFEWEKV